MMTNIHVPGPVVDHIRRRMNRVPPRRCEGAAKGGEKAYRQGYR